MNFDQTQQQNCNNTHGSSTERCIYHTLTKSTEFKTTFRVSRQLTARQQWYHCHTAATYRPRPPYDRAVICPDFCADMARYWGPSQAA